jgi:hypothetical protein
MRTLLAATVLAITGAVTAQAAEIFPYGAFGHAVRDGGIEHISSDSVTTHSVRFGEHLAASVSYSVEPDGLHLVVTVPRGEKQTAAVERVEMVLPAGRSITILMPHNADEVPEEVVLTNNSGLLQVAEPPVATSNQQRS